MRQPTAALTFVCPLFIALLSSDLLIVTSAADAKEPSSAGAQVASVPNKSYTSAGDLAASDEPGFMERMNTGTRAFFTRLQRSFSSEPKTAARNVSHRRKAPAKKSFGLGSLFKPAEPKPPRTVDEWIGLERPES